MYWQIYIYIFAKHLYVRNVETGGYHKDDQNQFYVARDHYLMKEISICIIHYNTI